MDLCNSDIRNVLVPDPFSCNLYLKIGFDGRRPPRQLWQPGAVAYKEDVR